MMLILIRNGHAHHAAVGLRAMAFVLVTAAGIFGSAAAAMAYEVVVVSNGGTIEGSVTLTGKPPAGATLKITKNQDYCGANIADPTYTVAPGGGLANVIVYLKDITKGKAGSTTPLPLANEKCMFIPRVQGAMVGESLKISSADTVLHNTHPQNDATNATIYNVALPFKGFSVTKPLPGMPGLIKIKCDAHEWMHAWIMELDHPYYATTDAEGHFVLKDVPPGTYTLVAWHEAAGETSTTVTVSAGQSAKTKLTLAVK
jgi:hypothetical protein